MPSRRASLVCAAALLLAGIGCSSPVDDGAVTTVRPVLPGGDDVGDRALRRVFPPPRPGAGPEEVVRGFLDAQAEVDDEHPVARLHLASDTQWDPTRGVVVYSGERTFAAQVQGSRARVTVRVQAEAVVTAAGEHRPVREERRLELALGLTAGEWRLTDVPEGLLLSASGLVRSSLRTTLWFPDPGLRRLVPEPRWLRARGSPTTAAAAALLAGPGEWLRPAVRSVVPRGSRLLGPVSVVGGVATVDLSREARNVPRDALAALAAQLTWTLTEPGLGVGSVRLLVEGKGLAIPGAAPAGTPFQRSTWDRFAPTAGFESPRTWFLRGGRLHVLAPDGEADLASAEPDRLVELTLSHSADVVAAVQRRGDVDALLVGPRLGRWEVVDTQSDLTSPSWHDAGSRVLAVRRPGPLAQVVSVAVGLEGVASPPTPVRLDTGGRPLLALRLSPDGARALVLLGGKSGGEAWIARVQLAGTVLSLTGLRPLVPGLGTVTALAWDGPQRVTLASSAETSLVRVSPDGAERARSELTGVPGAITSIAGGSTGDIVVASAGRLSRRTANGTWRVVADGAAPVLAG